MTRCLGCQSAFPTPPQVVAAPDQSPKSKLPRIWSGVLLTIACSVIVVLCLEVRPYTLRIVAVAGVMWVLPHTYWLFCVHRLHKVVREVNRETATSSPMRAVLGHFIPLWNLYWVFAWTSELDEWCARRTGAKPIPGIWGVLLLVGLLIYSKLDMTAGALILLTVIWILNRKVRAAILRPFQMPGAIDAPTHM